MFDPCLCLEDEDVHTLNERMTALENQVAAPLPGSLTWRPGTDLHYMAGSKVSLLVVSGYLPQLMQAMK